MMRKSHTPYKWPAHPPIFVPTGGSSIFDPAQGSATSSEGATTPCFCTMFCVISTPR